MKDRFDEYDDDEEMDLFDPTNGCTEVTGFCREIVTDMCK